MPLFTLKTRVTLVFPIIMTIVLAGILVLIYSLQYSYIKGSISRHQYQVLSLLASDIDQSVVDNQEELSIIASRITRKTIANPRLALRYLQTQSEHVRFFDKGLFLFDHAGRVVADTPYGVARSGQDLSFREYLKRTIATRKPFLSAPYESSQPHHHPAITFTVPVFDRDGSLMGVLGGSVDLVTSPLVEKLSRIKLTTGGYFYIFNKDRQLISHPDKSRIMKRDVPPGANKLFDRAINGFEGTDETVTSRGLHTLSSFKRLKTKDWIIAANYPVSEAFAPLKKLKIVFLIILPLLSLATFWLMRRHLKRLTDPVIDLTRHVEGLQQAKGAERLIPLQGSDEIAILGQTFNMLVLENDRQQEKLQIEVQRQELIDQQLQRQNSYLQALHTITLELLGRRDLNSVLESIVTRAGKLIGTEHCFIYMINEAGTAMDMVFQSGIYDHLLHQSLTPGQGIAGQVWESKEPFHVDDYSHWEGRLADRGRDALRAMAGVPLTSDHEVVGVLGLSFTEPGIVFDDEKMALLCQFGDMASLALENARIYEQSQHELSERKRAEEHLRQLSVAVEQSPSSIIITNTSGVIEYANPYFSLLTGYLPDEVIGKNPRILKTGETSPEEYKDLWDTILSGGVWRGEFRNRKKNGDLYWERALIAPIRDEQDTITHFICIKEDITGYKQLENQLRHVQKLEAVGQLAGGIAHDFNNILTAIIGYSSIMQLKLPADNPMKEYAGQIIATAERGAGLTQGLLAFSRKQPTSFVVVDLNEILGRIQQLLLRLITEDIHLKQNLSAKQLPVRVDSAQIEQVVMNLATNSRDAMPKGGSILITTETVTIDSDFILERGFGQPGKFALLTFSDSGEGMDSETVKHIFEPFFTTKELGKGTGLGLSIIYGIIKTHNGYITCASTVGSGTSFYIYLPLLGDLPDVEKTISHEHPPPSQSSRVILLAEDDDSARTLAKEVLEEFGFVVLEARDGQEALEVFKDNRERIALIILDVIMPRLKGREVYDAVLGIAPEMKMLFCSGYAEDLVIAQLGQIHELNYLVKPFSPKELLMKIREVLHNGN